MKNEIFGKRVLLVIMATIFILSTIVYVGSCIIYMGTHKIDAIEIATYIVGYFMTDICLGLAIYAIASNKRFEVSLWAAFACMVLRLIYDILIVLADGLYLSGLFQMDIFIALDVIIMVCILVVIKSGNRVVNCLLVAFVAVYLFGEAAGYPMKTFDDIDEFVLIFSLLAVVTVPLIPIKNDLKDGK